MLHGIVKHVKNGAEDFYSRNILSGSLSIDLKETTFDNDFIDFKINTSLTGEAFFIR